MSATCWPQSKQRVLTNSFSLGTYILIIKVALKTGNSWAFGLPSRTWSSDDYQAGVSSLLKLRGTFNPPPPPPCPLVPAVEPIPGASIPAEVCSLLNLISTKRGGGEGGIIPWDSKEQGTTIFKSLSAGHFPKCLWTQLSKQNFLKNLSKLRPCSIWPKMDGCSKTLNFLKRHLLQHYFWSLNVTFSVFEYRNVCLINDTQACEAEGSKRYSTLERSWRHLDSTKCQSPWLKGVYSSPCPELRRFFF